MIVMKPKNISKDKENFAVLQKEINFLLEILYSCIKLDQLSFIQIQVDSYDPPRLIVEDLKIGHKFIILHSSDCLNDECRENKEKFKFF